MKSLTEKLHEAMYSVILEELQSVWKGTPNNAKETIEIKDKIKEFCAGMVGKKKISLHNKQKVQKTFNAFIDKMPFGDRTRNLNILKKYGLATEEGFARFILGSHDELKKDGCYIDWVEQWDLSKAEKAYKKAKEAGEIPDPISDDEADERDLVIYDRWNPANHEVYPFKGKRGKGTDQQVNQLRVDFRYKTGVEYYDCYPILWKNYLGKEEELKRRAEMQIGYDDPNEFK